MLVYELFESQPTDKKLLVTYPGRFQPFHQGHAAVFHKLQAQFGRDAVYIVTGNKTDGTNSPFNFSDKIRLMTAAGIPADRILEVTNTYKFPDQFAAHEANTVFITAVGAPDRDRLKPDSYKKDGSPAYYKTWTNMNDAVTADQHGYVLVMPEEHKVITIGGKSYDVSHGTECRALWRAVAKNSSAAQEYIKQLYPKADKTLSATLNKILAVTEGVDTHVDTKKNLASRAVLRKAKLAFPQAQSDAEAVLLYLDSQEQRDVNRLDQENRREDELIDKLGTYEENLNKKVRALEIEIAEIRKAIAQAHPPVQEATGYIPRRGKESKDPRWSNALTVDVHPDTLQKEIDAFFPTKAPKTQQRQIKSGREK
jgi:hypothetical protein